MKKIASVAGWMAALMVACCPCTAEMSVQDGHVYGQKEIDGKRIVYDFDVPEEVESVKQYRTEAVRMKPEWVEQILKPYVQKPRSGDAWDLINDGNGTIPISATLNRMEDTHVRAAVT